jgi:hypothetical protein
VQSMITAYRERDRRRKALPGIARLLRILLDALW